MPSEGRASSGPTNGGVTWTQLGATANSNFYYVNDDVVVSPVNSARLYAATRIGVFRSLDNGASWTSVQDAAAVNGCTDLAIRTDTPTDSVFAACGAFATGTIYRNADAGGSGTWTAVYTNTSMGRASLAIAPRTKAPYIRL